MWRRGVLDPTLAESARDQARESGGRHAEILDAATAMFAASGFNDTDTQELAERVGVGKGTIYRCFPSKRDLFLAAADRAMHRLRLRMEESAEGVEDPLERVSRAVRAYLDFFSDHPESVELLIQERALFKDRKQPTYFDHRDRDAEFWRELYRGLIGAGRVREMPVDRIRDVMSQVLYGTIFTNYFRGARPSSEEQAAAILDVVFLGILSETERTATGRRLFREGARPAGEGPDPPPDCRRST